MTSPIGGTPASIGLSQAGLATRTGASSPPVDASFQNLLVGSIEQVHALDQSAQVAIERSLAGDDITQVEVFSSVKKADLALRMMLQVRNKLLEAYDEIKRMQL